MTGNAPDIRVGLPAAFGSSSARGGRRRSLDECSQRGFRHAPVGAAVAPVAKWRAAGPNGDIDDAVHQAAFGETSCFAIGALEVAEDARWKLALSHLPIQTGNPDVMDGAAAVHVRNIDRGALLANAERTSGAAISAIAPEMFNRGGGFRNGRATMATS